MRLIAREQSSELPLVVDLDGTLCRTDTLHEALFALMSTTPSAWPRAVAGLFQGRAAFKARIAAQSIADPATLPYNPDVLATIEAARRLGRRVELVSAADQRQIDAVADHLGLFDVAIGTGSATGGPENLRGAAKAAMLVARHGDKSFDYIGDSRADLEVWPHARRAIVAAPSRDLLARMRRMGLAPEELGARSALLPALLRGMRPHQWAKNLLIFLPPFAAHDPSGFVPALYAFVAFSLVASGVYLLNDLLDLTADRIHPRKRHRPIASGSLPLLYAVCAAAGLFVAGIGLAAILLPVEFLAVLLIYLASTCAYSFSLKRKMMIDIIALSGLYTLRIWAGGVATGIVLSTWLLVFSMFLFFALAAMKRQAELESLQKIGVTTNVAGRNLALDDLWVIQSMSIAAGQIAVLVFALYATDSATVAMYGRPGVLLFVCPLLFFWLGRLQLLTRRGFMTDDPIVFTMRDRISLICGALIAGLMLIAGMQ